MTDLDVAILTVSVGIITFILGLVFTRTQATWALRREVALRPYSEKFTALKTVYVSMMDYAYTLNREVNRGPATSLTDYQQRFGEPIDEFTGTLYRNGIWLKNVESKLLEVLGTFRQTGLAMMPGITPGAVNVPWMDLLQKPATAGKAIGDELRIDILDQQLNSLLSGLRIPGSGTQTTTSQSSTQSSNPNRDVDLLKVNLAADYRLGWLIAWIGVYFALIIGLVIAWYQKYGATDSPGVPIGYLLIVGVFGTLLATQELLPYKTWLVHVDDWLRMVENNQRLPDLKVIVKLRDRLKSTGHGILILMFLADFYLTILQFPSAELFALFSALGIIVAFFTQGGIDLIKKWTV